MSCACGSNGCSGNRENSAVEAIGVQAFVPHAEPEPETEMIASSEQQWPRIKVNGQAIAAEAIAQELQYHPAASRDEAVFLASQALVIRLLLQQRAAELGLRDRDEEALTAALLQREVAVPHADEAAGRRYYEANRARFASAPLLAVRHILLACAADDVEARIQKRELADVLIAQVTEFSSRFDELVQAHSDCPSKQQGGALGQISQGQTVPEFERQLFRLPVGLAAQPLESRYGWHVVQVDQRIEGQQLPYEAVAGSIRAELDQRVWQVAVAQYLKQVVGEANIQGIVLDGVASPLTQ